MIVLISISTPNLMFMDAISFEPVCFLQESEGAVDDQKVGMSTDTFQPSIQVILH
jgi:hypothetical protein